MERAEAEAIYGQGREVVVGVLVALSERMAAQDARIAKLVARVEELDRRLKRNSRNSSTPPSQDPAGAPERRRPPSAGRSQGAQPGHLGHGRPLAPFELVDEVVDHWPERCGCGHLFSEAEREPVAGPARHQVAELPPIAVVVSEHRLHRLRCPDCGGSACAEIPSDVPSGAFGPRLQAAVATLSVRNRVCRRDAAELVRELFGARVSSGAIDAIVQPTGEALAEPYESLLDQIRSAPAVNIDETGWRLRGGKRTLWGAFTQQAALLHVAPDRHQRELTTLLGEQFSGIACSDRWWAYNSLPPKQRQVCWSHPIRDFSAHSEGLPSQTQLGEAGLQVAEQLFCAWHDLQQDGDRRTLIKRTAPLKREPKTLLTSHAHKSARNRYTRTFANNLLKLWPALSTFTQIDGVEPTNNSAERGLRGAVIYRKLSLGSQSEAGEQTIEPLLSASHTCRLQQRSLFTYLTHALAANTRGDPVPSLI